MSDATACTRAAVRANSATRAPSAADVRSIWVGLRPLVRPPDDEGGNTKSISREHTVLASPSGLVTVTGGKWTTYRAMAEDVARRMAYIDLMVENDFYEEYLDAIPEEYHNRIVIHQFHGFIIFI